MQVGSFQLYVLLLFEVHVQRGLIFFVRFVQYLIRLLVIEREEFN